MVGARLAVGLVLAVLAVKVGAVGPAPGVGSPHSVTGAFLHWDATWYRDITRFGYATAAQRTSFFPLYPLLVRLLAATGLPYAAAALGLGWLAFFFATWSVIELCGLLLPGTRSARAGALFAWFPMSVFLLSGYPESLYAALAGWSFVFVARRRYAPAVALAALASATRPEGILVGTAAVVSLLVARRYGQAVLAAFGGASGLAVFSLYCWAHFGSPIEYEKVQADWYRRTTLPFVMIVRNLEQLLSRGAGGADYRFGFVVGDALVVGAAVGLVCLVRLALRHGALRPFVPFTALTVLVAASNSTRGVYPDGAGRMLIALLPLYVVSTRMEGRTWRIVMAGSCVLAVSVQMLFNAGGAII